MRLPVSLSLLLLTLASLSILAQTPASPQAPQAVAQTPPMGWNSWNFFFGKVTDKDIRDSADQIVATGMKDAGYVYVNIDDTWEGERDASGVLHSNSKFPDMKALADYVHSKGLKLGIYSGPGPRTCAGYAGSLGHEEQDAQLYASWGIDYLKYDLCSFNEEVMSKQAPGDRAAQMRLMVAAYDKMNKAIKATGRPIVFSFCQYGWDAVWEWGPSVGANLPTGTASTPSPASRWVLSATPAPATGTIPICWRWATANSPWPKIALTFRYGPYWPRPCWPATTCPT
jgi:alpha-galactosidase